MKIETKTYFVVDYNDLDEAISKEYDFKQDEHGFAFESIAAEEWNNYSNYIINVDGENDKWNQEKVDKREDTSGSVRAYLNDMAKKGLIPKGQYLIRVSW